MAMLVVLLEYKQPEALNTGRWDILNILFLLRRRHGVTLQHAYRHGLDICIRLVRLKSSLQEWLLYLKHTAAKDSADYRFHKTVTANKLYLFTLTCMPYMLDDHKSLADAKEVYGNSLFSEVLCEEHIFLTENLNKQDLESQWRRKSNSSTVWVTRVCRG